MDLPLNYCWFTTFSLAWLDQLDMKVRLRQDHTDPTAFVLTGWQNVKVFALRPAERVRYYVGDNVF